MRIIQMLMNGKLHGLIENRPESIVTGAVVAAWLIYTQLLASTICLIVIMI